MSINNGQPVDETTDNAAFMSRTSDTDTTGKVDLKNADSAEVTDVQGTINTIKTDATALDGRVTTNETNIGTNATNIATNTSNISANDTDIATNAADIANLDAEFTNHTHNGTDSNKIEGTDIKSTGEPVDRVLASDGLGGVTWSASGGGGASEFTALTDTPVNYTGSAGLVPTVNDTEDGLIFKASSGIGSPSIYLLLDADSINVNDFTDTNGILTEDTTETDNKRYLLTNTAGSTGYEASYTQVLQSDAKSRRTHICKIYNSDYTGTKGNVTLVIEDQASNVLDTIIIDPDVKTQQKIFSVPDTVTSIVVKPTIVTGEDTATWTFDKIAFDYSPFGEASLEKKETITHTGYLSGGGGTITFKTKIADDSSELIELDTSTETRYVAKRRVNFVANTGAYVSGTGVAMYMQHYAADGLTVKQQSYDYDPDSVFAKQGALSGVLEAGEYIVVYCNNSLQDSNYTFFSVTASATQDYVLVEDERSQAHSKGGIVITGGNTGVQSTTAGIYTDVSKILSYTSISTYGDVTNPQDGTVSVSFESKKGTVVIDMSNGLISEVGGTIRLISRFYDSSSSVSSSETIVHGDNTDYLEAGSTSYIVEIPSDGEYTFNLQVKSDSTAGYLVRATQAPITINVSYLPPSTEKKVPTTYALPKSEVQDFVGSYDHSELSFSVNSKDITLTRNAAGDYTLNYSGLELTSIPNIVVDMDTQEWDLDIRKSPPTLTSCSIKIRQSSVNTFYDRDFTVRLSKTDADRRDGEVFVGNVPKEQVMYIVPSLTDYLSSEASSTSYKTRSIAEVRGDIFSSTSSNQLNIPAGKYAISAPVGGFGNCGLVSFLIYNVTDSLNIAEFNNVAYNTNTEQIVSTNVHTMFELNEGKTIEFRTKSSVASGDERLGHIEIRKLS